MLILLTPSKTMDFVTPAPSFVHATTPKFLPEAERIMRALQRYDVRHLQQLMRISEPLAQHVHTMVSQWRKEGEKPALWAYKGDVYKGMLADTISAKNAVWAQEHLLIMSGVYGALRPFDAMRAYRLEMKTNLPVGDAKHLYDFWGETIANYAEARANGVIVNACSDEYAQIVTKRVSEKTTIITPTFFDKKPSGTVAQVPIYSKMMRGVFARWMIDKTIENPAELQRFAAHGYSYNEALSKPNAPAFFRERMTPLKFN